MILIMEGIVMCFILLIYCAVGIANGADVGGIPGGDDLQFGQGLLQGG